MANVITHLHNTISWKWPISARAPRRRNDAMNPAEIPIREALQPTLRVHRREELDEAESVAILSLGPSEAPTEAEVEAFWAGRSPAARHSARVAA
jgi:hypothetical protein